MFSKLPTLKKFSKEILTIEQLQSIVKNNPQSEYIEYIRGLEYKSKEYNTSKLNVSCIMPHGIFVNGIKNTDIESFSGYLFYDIDGIDTKDELNDTIKRLCDTFPISFLQRSLSNKGFHFLIKLDDTFSITNDTFLNVYDYVRSLLIDKGFNIDLSANGLSRKMIISSDKFCILNSNNSLSIDILSFNNFSMLRNTNGKVKICKSNKDMSITLNDTFSIIPIKELLQQINIQTQYVKEIDGDYVMENIEFYTILLPEIIKDGTKHRLYTRIVNGLYFINGVISRQQVISYLFYVNNRANPPMDNKYLYNFLTRLCDNIEQNGVKIKPRIKRIHFNKDSNLTKKQKQIMAAKVIGNERTNKTIKLIRDTRTELLCINEKDTQKAVQILTGLSIATIKRNWNKDVKVIDIEIPMIKDNIKEEQILEVIEEENFFNDNSIEKEEILSKTEDMRVIEYKYKNFKDIKIEITKKDKEDFKAAIDRLNKAGFEICLSTLELCGLNKYKLEYLYNIWYRKNKIVI